MSFMFRTSASLEPGRRFYSRGIVPICQIEFDCNVLGRPAGDLMLQDFYIPDATLSVVLDAMNSEYRMILLSGCTSMCVSMTRRFSTATDVIIHNT
jgi:hypothetical protein